MPVSVVCESAAVTAAIRDSLATSTTHGLCSAISDDSQTLQSKSVASAKRVLLTKVEYEEVKERLVCDTRWCAIRRVSVSAACDEKPRNLGFGSDFWKRQTLCSLNQSKNTSAPKNEKDELLAAYPSFIKDIRECASEFGGETEQDWIEKVFDYNVPCGKLIRGSSTLRACKHLFGESQWTPENQQKACYLGWCNEVYFTFFVMFDDVIDHGETRRGKACWYRVKGVDMKALNDAIMMLNIKDHIFEKFCGDEKKHAKVSKVFREVAIGTTLGENVDIEMQKCNVTQFSMDIYQKLVNKSTYITYYLSLITALHLTSKHTDDTIIRQIKPILLQIGYLFQIQDDFLDCFGDQDKFRKIGTDIRENKCSWLAVKCIELASQKQKDIMIECYGQNDPTKIERVKELYLELDLPNVFSRFEQSLYDEINAAISEIPSGLFRNLISDNLNEIYRRVA